MRDSKTLLSSEQEKEIERLYLEERLPVRSVAYRLSLPHGRVATYLRAKGLTRKIPNPRHDHAWRLAAGSSVRETKARAKGRKG